MYNEPLVVISIHKCRMGNYNNLALDASSEDFFYNNEKLNNSDIHYAATCIKAMAHPLRLKILFILSNGEKISVQNLVKKVGTTQSNISQHLSLLKQMGILVCDRQANKSFYKIATPEVTNFMGSIHAVFVDSK